MLTARFERYGPPSSVLEVQETADPIPGSGEVLVEIHAAAINHSDVANVRGLMETPLPRTPGRDFAGVIAGGPEHLLGVAVFGTGGDLGFSRDGTHAQYVVLPESGVVEKPASLGMDEAAAVGVSFVTAWAGLVEAAQVQAGETVAVIGAAGSVGRAAVQIAKWCGARVIGIDRPESGIASLGNVDFTIDSPDVEMEAAVFEYTEGHGADVVFNAVGGARFGPGMRLLAKRGRQVAIASIGDRRVSFDLVDFYRREGRLLGVNTLTLDAAACARILAQVTPGFEAGALDAPRLDPRRFPLRDIASGYEYVDHGITTGRVILTPQAV